MTDAYPGFRLVGYRNPRSGNLYKLDRKTIGSDWEPVYAPATEPGDERHGWGVWHSEDRQWIGWGVTHTIATDMIPSDAHSHLVILPAIAIVNPDYDEWDDYMRTEGHDLFTDEASTASIKRGIADVEAGRVVDLGSFAQYLEDQDEQSDENMQAGVLPGGEVAPAPLLEDEPAGVASGIDDRPGPRTAPTPTDGEVGSGVTEADLHHIGYLNPWSGNLHRNTPDLHPTDDWVPVYTWRKDPAQAVAFRRDDNG